ncbi:hypothetical protein [Listeria monocytogenes]|uniref:hypothetical protein n=1 Tax=Listeria monocytogenes TaxID=1639 RepID=UPI003B434F56
MKKKKEKGKKKVNTNKRKETRRGRINYTIMANKEEKPYPFMEKGGNLKKSKAGRGMLEFWLTKFEDWDRYWGMDSC